MAILQLVPAGDLAMANGTFVYTEGADFVRQKLACRFRFFLGEWFLDQRQGIPYFRDVFIKNPNLRVIRILFRRVLSTCPGVTAIEKFDVVYDATARSLSFDFVVATDGGPVIVGPTDRDFIVDFSA